MEDGERESETLDENANERSDQNVRFDIRSCDVGSRKGRSRDAWRANGRLRILLMVFDVGWRRLLFPQKTAIALVKFGVGTGCGADRRVSHSRVS